MTPDEAWLAGLIWADGSLSPVSSARHSWKITTTTTDEQMGREIARITAEPIRTYQPRRANRRANHISYLSGRPVRRLVDMGLTQDKTNECRMPNIDPDLLPHFIRGFFDGDGTVTLGTNPKVGHGMPRLKSGFVGTRDMMNDLLGELQAREIGLRVNVVRHAPIWAIHLNHADSLRLADLMYVDRSGACLLRKRDLFDLGR